MGSGLGFGMTQKLKIGVLISGRGSNLQALIEAHKAPDFPAEIVLVLSNKADAYGLERARLAGIPCATISHKDYLSRTEFEAALTENLRRAGVNLVCLAGFMRILSPAFIKDWSGCVLNIHPSLLPKYKGLDTHKRALDAGDREAGCTVHIVTADLDDGPILLQKAVPIEPGDTPETLATRVLAAEHQIYPEAVRLMAARLRAA